MGQVQIKLVVRRAEEAGALQKAGVVGNRTPPRLPRRNTDSSDPDTRFRRPEPLGDFYQISTFLVQL